MGQQATDTKCIQASVRQEAQRRNPTHVHGRSRLRQLTCDAKPNCKTVGGTCPCRVAGSHKRCRPYMVFQQRVCPRARKTICAVAFAQHSRCGCEWLQGRNRPFDGAELGGHTRIFRLSLSNHARIAAHSLRKNVEHVLEEMFRRVFMRQQHLLARYVVFARPQATVSDVALEVTRYHVTTCFTRSNPRETRAHFQRAALPASSQRFKMTTPLEQASSSAAP